MSGPWRKDGSLGEKQDSHCRLREQLPRTVSSVGPGDGELLGLPSPPKYGEAQLLVQHEALSRLRKPSWFGSLMTSRKYGVKASRISLHLGLCSTREGTPSLPSPHPLPRLRPL